MERVLIVSKTRMSSGVCVSGLTRTTSRSIRLIPPNRHNQPIDTKYEIGQVWEMDFYDVSPTTPPHVEDVIVTNERFVSTVPNIRELFMQRVQPWQGGPQQLFDGLLLFGRTGKGYVTRQRGIPGVSTGFWLPEKPLTKIYVEDKLNYCYDDATHDEYKGQYLSGERGILFEAQVMPTFFFPKPPEGRRARYNIPYVGCAEAIDLIPAGTLVRVSLARWWRPEGMNEERCYLQLSGWYL